MNAPYPKPNPPARLSNGISVVSPYVYYAEAKLLLLQQVLFVISNLACVSFTVKC